MDWSIWGPPLAVLAAGLVAGLLLTLRGQRRWVHSPRIADLQARKQVLVAQLRDLEGDREKLEPGIWKTRHDALVDETATVLRSLDEDTPAVDPRNATAPTAGARHFGIYLGLLAVFAVGAAWVLQDSDPQPDASSGMMGGSSSSSGGSAPSADEPDLVREARVEWASDPTNLDACNRITQWALYTGDLQSAMAQRDSCAALNAEDPTVLTHLQALRIVIGRFDDAGAELDTILANPGAPDSAKVWRALVYINLGDLETGTAMLREVQDHGKDPLDVEFAGFVLVDLANPSSGAGSSGGQAPSTPPPSAAAPKLSGTVTGDLPPGGVLFVYVRASDAAVGMPLGAKRIASWSLPLEFTLSESDLLPMSGGVWPEQVWVQAKVARSGDPKQPDPGDVESVVYGPVAPGATLEIKLGE